MLTISEQIKTVFPGIRVAGLWGSVRNNHLNEELWRTLEDFIYANEGILTPDIIRELPAIRHAKDAYRKLGKDPNRYRVSAEAMLRRIGSGKGLYQINSLVDCLNLASVMSGITIGGFDFDKVLGDLTLDIGEENEQFEAIGRGEINIHRLPVYRDKKGPIGSPTSDCIRTMILPETTKFLMIITDFWAIDPVEDVIQHLKELITKYCNGEDLHSKMF